MSGTVTDKYEGGPVIGTTVTWGDGKGTTTDLEGNYSITVDAGDTIRFMYLGYTVQKLDRVYYAGLTKKNLKRGDWRFLTRDEVMRLKTGQYE